MTSTVGSTVNGPAVRVLKDATAVQALDIDQLHKRSWSTSYPLSERQVFLARRLSALLSTNPTDAVGDIAWDRLFCLLERPKNDAFGHFSLPLPQLPVAGKTPVEAAKALASDLMANSQLPASDDASSFTILKANSVGPFLNVTFDEHKLLRDTVRQVLTMGDEYGRTDVGHGKRVMVEFCSCNVGKPFHAGHLRTTIIGNFVKNLYLNHGFHTLGINYLGDWGKQYGLLALGFAKYGDEEALEQDANRHLYEVYVRINRDLGTDPTLDDQAKLLFLKMERGDPEVLALWRRFRDLSIVNYKRVLARLGVHHDIYSGESFYDKLMPARIQELRDSSLLQESKGAQLVDLDAYGLGKAIILKGDGATLYLTRDIAAAQDRFDSYALDRSVYVVGCQQDLHLAQLKKICELMGKPWAAQIVHINFGLVKGMSTRKGTAVFLEDILDESKEVMLGVMQKNPAKYNEIADPDTTADVLAVSALIVQDLSSKRIKDYDFSMQRMTQFEGDTGPYLQYAHARIASIHRKYGQGILRRDLLESADLALLTEPEAANLALTMARYPEVCQEALRTMEPSLIVHFCMSLAKCISVCLDHLYVSGQPAELARARLALYEGSRIVLGNGMRLLGLRPLERI
jgi:arginyl-tRNA synthetase